MLLIKRLRLVIFIIAAIIAVVILFFLPDFFFNRGLNFYKTGSYISAHKNFARAKCLAPSNKEYRYYYVQNLAKLKPSAKIQEEMFKFIEDGKGDSASISAGINAAVWKNNINQLYGNNYIEQVPINGDIIRWNPKTFPLKVFFDIQDTAAVPEYYNTEVMRAFGQWQSSSGFLSFKFIDTPNKADIVVKFAPLPKNTCTEDGCKYVVAFTIPTINKHILKKMTITLYDRDANGNYISDKELYNTALHEIGHALGIMGHSYSTDDLMFMTDESVKNSILTRYRSDFQYISAQDINTLRLLYNIIPTITNTPVGDINTENLIYPPIIFGSSKNMTLQKLKEAENYVSKAPNIPDGYIDMAIAYDELGEFDKALEVLQKAFNKAQTGNDKYIILYNYAVIYLNNDKPETALGYAQQAKHISNTSEIADLISNIEHSIGTKTKPFKGKKLLKQ